MHAPQRVADVFSLTPSRPVRSGLIGIREFPHRSEMMMDKSSIDCNQVKSWEGLFLIATDNDFSE